MEERYWELREECGKALDKWMTDKRESSREDYKIAFSTYQDFCMDVLERLMDKDPDVLKILK